MSAFSQLVDGVFSDSDVLPESIPDIDLYIDQVLTLFNDGLAGSRRHAGDKLLTRSMVNNYSKEKLLLPVKGKKYSREQLMQILCVYQLKQLLPLADVKSLTGRTDVDFEGCYRSYLDIKERLRAFIPPLLEQLDPDLGDPSEVLSLALALSAVSTYMRRLAESVIDARAAAEADPQTPSKEL